MSYLFRAGMMHAILAAHAATQLRELDPPDRGSLTDAEVNSVQQEIELRASNEFDEVTDRVRDWLVNNSRVRADYCQFRSALLSEDEQLEIEIMLGIRQ